MTGHRLGQQHQAAGAVLDLVADFRRGAPKHIIEKPALGCAGGGGTHRFIDIDLAWTAADLAVDRKPGGGGDVPIRGEASPRPAAAQHRRVSPHAETPAGYPAGRPDPARGSWLCDV